MFKPIAGFLLIGLALAFWQTPLAKKSMQTLVHAGDAQGAGGMKSSSDVAAVNIDFLQDLVSKREDSDFETISLDDSNASSRMQYMLNEAVDRLSDGKIKDLRLHLSHLATRRSKLASDLDKAKFSAASAGENLAEVSGVKVFQKEISELDNEARSSRSELLSSLEKIGIHLSERQLDGLLIMATSDSFIDMMSAFDNLRTIDAELLRATEASGESTETAKRYYGIHATLAESAAWLQWKFIDDIDKKYLPELQRISAEALSLKEQSSQLLGDAGDDRTILEGNIQAQELTLRTADIYRSELLKQRDSIAQSYQRTARQVTVAINTWKTVRVSSDLISMMRSSESGFHQLLSLQLPDLRPFQGSEIRSEFQRISERLVAAK